MVVGDAFDAGFEVGGIEIDEKSEGFSRELEICDELGGVDGGELLYGFEFDDDGIFNE